MAASRPDGGGVTASRRNNLQSSTNRNPKDVQKVCVSESVREEKDDSCPVSTNESSCIIGNNSNPADASRNLAGSSR
ncbi:hypothetical protein BLNAU_16895 [Blattamonas nauphoetae]|uniref:Uncharacterized protein n=1 Tax=Blattamonas nauphoetae TaxID=2049346 RepID=A0ABQ9X7Y2_9EUKA|nr:hypothetical protein BLNAU_16895 [Blattamonas nauphoetae]